MLLVHASADASIASRHKRTACRGLVAPRISGVEIVAVEDLAGAGGFTPALRQIATLADGTTAFVKTPTSEVTRKMLLAEIAAYEAIGPQPFCPRVLDASPDRLVLEDLRHAHWPPPWRPGDIDLVLETMRAVAATPAPLLPTFEERWVGQIRMWDGVDVDAVVVLGFERDVVARLTAAGREIDAAATYDGDALLHMDLRSDNLCVLDDRPVLVDWNGACRGEAGLDEVAWAPSLALEGGPMPWDLLPDAALHHVSFLTGYFANRSPMPPIPDAPRVRAFQLAQLRVCIPWFARLVGA